MWIEEENDFESKKIKNEINSKKNLLLLFFDYCDTKDILNLSLVSKRFNELVNEFMDYKFRYAIEKNYFSNYDNYE